MTHIPVKLKKQGKQCQFCIRVFNQNTLDIQLLSGNSPESVQVPDLRLIIKNPGIIQNCFHQSFCPWILPVRVKLYPYFTDPEVYPPVCRKIITAGKQITDKRRIRALPFCKMINFQISRKTYHLSVTPLL